MRFRHVILAALAISPLAVAQDGGLDSLAWVAGPSSQSLWDHSALNVPPGYVFLDRENTDRFLVLTENLPSGTEYLIAPDDLHWWAVLEFEDSGYVEDDDELDAEALLTSLREGQEAANEELASRGWETFQITGWSQPPRYDEITRRLEWGTRLKVASSPDETVNFTTRFLGRRGVTSATLVTGLDTVATDTEEFKSVLTGYDFNAGERYADYREGDKLAGYGLAALITGGAAAGLAKSGLLVKFLKPIAIGVMALLAGIVSFFRRKK